MFRCRADTADSLLYVNVLKTNSFLIPKTRNFEIRINGSRAIAKMYLKQASLNVAKIYQNETALDVLFMQ